MIIWTFMTAIPPMPEDWDDIAGTNCQVNWFHLDPKCLSYFTPILVWKNEDFLWIIQPLTVRLNILKRLV
jgi:hypothetical protein